MMNWDTAQQLLRIGLYSGGSYLFGESIAASEPYRAAVGGAIAIASFVWWYFWERKRS